MEIELELLKLRVDTLEREHRQLKDETIASLQASFDKLERYLSRIQNIAIGMAAYFLLQQLGFAELLKAVLL